MPLLESDFVQVDTENFGLTSRDGWVCAVGFAAKVRWTLLMATTKRKDRTHSTSFFKRGWAKGFAGRTPRIECQRRNEGIKRQRTVENPHSHKMCMKPPIVTRANGILIFQRGQKEKEETRNERNWENVKKFTRLFGYSARYHSLALETHHLTLNLGVATLNLWRNVDWELTFVFCKYSNIFRPIWQQLLEEAEV